MALVRGLLFITIVIFQDGKVQGIFNDGDFILQPYHNLTIDTTECRTYINKTRHINLTCEDQTFESSYSYKVAYFKYQENIVFKRGSVVLVRGDYALSIQSSHGNITIDTDVIMTCGEASPTAAPTCVGGYRRKTTQTSNSKLYPGNGPGWIGDQYVDDITSSECVGGAGHGGYGGGKIMGNSPFSKTYGLDQFDALVGGSAGIFQFDNQSHIAGGGAIEVKAPNGTITIGAHISASASQGTHVNGQGLFTGGSGGLVRLQARRVTMRSTGSLSVDGSDGNPHDTWTKAGGGGGGIIQIDAPRGLVANLSLVPGESKNCGDSSSSAPGHLIIVSNEAGSPHVFYNRSVPSISSFEWPTPIPTTMPSSPIVPSSPVSSSLVPSRPVHSSPVPPLLNRTTSIVAALRKVNSTVNMSVILTLLTEMHHLSLRTDLTPEQLRSFVEMFKIFENILGLLHDRPDDSREIFLRLLKIGTSLLDARHMETWKKTEQLPSFLAIIEAMAIHVAKISTSMHHNTNNIALQIRSFDTGAKAAGKFPDYALIPDGFLATESTYVIIPKDAFADVSGDYKLVIMMFKSVQDGMPQYLERYNIRSVVLSCTLLSNGSVLSVLQKPAQIYFTIKPVEGQRVNSTMCSYWNDGKGVWENEGVTVGSGNKTRVVCRTKHFTNFAVLMQHTPIPMSEAEQLSLLIITYIGCGISSGTLVIALIILISIESLSTERHRIHLNLVLALLIAQIIFLSGITATNNKIACAVIAAALHYFYTAAFTWMLNEGVHLYLKIVKVFRIESVKLKHYYIFGWGFPALIVAISAAIKPNSYGTKTICWLSLDDNLVWAFIGPVVAIIAANSFILIMVVKTVVVSASSVNSSDHAHIRAGLKGALVLMPLLGVSWISGLLAVNRDTVLFQYVFAITNSFQGFMIFLLHIVFNNEVRTAFRRHREKHQLSKDSDYNASYSSTHENNRNASLKHKSEKSSSSSSSRGFSRLKARLSMSMLPRTSRVISVQPLSTKDDDASVHVNRAFTRGNSTKLKPPEPDAELSSLNCPAGLDEARPPYHHQLDSARFRSNKI